MPRLRSKLNKTSQKKIDVFCKRKCDELNIDSEKFKDILTSYILDDVRYVREATEKNIVDLYLQFGNTFESDISDFEILDNKLKDIRKKIRRLLSRKLTSKTHDNCIDIYFNEVKREYINHPQQESQKLEFGEKNKDIFILNNLKLVVSIAKKYRGFGLPFEDLIQVGNLGLLIAFEKFDSTRNTLREKVIKLINESQYSIFSKQEVIDILNEVFTYDNMLEKIDKKIPEEGFESKEDFIKWTRINIKTAAFASVSYRWIESAIRQELARNKTTIKFPKANKAEELYKPNNYVISLDSINPYTDDNYNDNLLGEVSNDEFIKEDERILSDERNEYFKNVLNSVFSKLTNLERRVIKRKFGIDFPVELNNQEIAESENISLSEVKNILANAMSIIEQNIPKNVKDNILELFS